MTGLPQLRVLRADYADAGHARALVSLLDAYAQDPAGGGHALSEHVKTHLVSALAARPQAYSVLAWDGDLPVGLVNCIEGFSTFQCRALVNVHDVVVLASQPASTLRFRLARSASSDGAVSTFSGYSS